MIYHSPFSPKSFYIGVYTENLILDMFLYSHNTYMFEVQKGLFHEVLYLGQKMFFHTWYI